VGLQQSHERDRIPNTSEDLSWIAEELPVFRQSAHGHGIILEVRRVGHHLGLQVLRHGGDSLRAESMSPGRAHRKDSRKLSQVEVGECVCCGHLISGASG